ncbi:MAG: hypothetical protein A3F54_01380 [Candidatus Kerfeldbacteria bacterium RIFCSPHIGHO2_12_FULL_48_17]|uniref:Sortilin N-terminal domain-containing protein n=1 Tax=Candidatus Kerfeldbacteria bacterium RIFCSPHIGHO2_12_FULL_48_17 TaxID=1798542 RepID=A0A1G2AYC0_9BACT|nr:MAG: hypothetical protein A3F54_01380 [Candidatus Kerfeldbacteria bacterium RIFCSPHIGHO2_12_FULL_48_17]
MKFFHLPGRFALAMVSLVFFVGCGKAEVPIDGGVFLSVDGAETWHDRSNAQFIVQSGSMKDFTVNQLMFDPLEPRIVYAATAQAGLFISENDGEVWKQTTLGGNIARLDINRKNTKILFASSKNEVAKSVDQGKTWETVYVNTNRAAITDVFIDFTTPSRILISTADGNILQSIDNGINWQVIYSLEPKRPITRIVSDPANSSALYILVPGSGFEKSTDGGVTWQPFVEVFKEFPDARNITAFVIDPTDTAHIIIASRFGLLESRDAGGSWGSIETLLKDRVNIESLVINPLNPRTVYFVVGNLIHKTEDGGRSWMTLEGFPSTRPITQLLVHPVETSVLYAGTKKITK